MQNPLPQRLSQLREEFSNGQTMLVELETQQRQLRESLLRISGAIQVLEEVMAAEQTPGGHSDANASPNASLNDSQVEQATKKPFGMARAE